MANKVILEVENLTKYFNTPGGLLHAVDGVNFKVEEGRTLGLSLIHIFWTAGAMCRTMSLTEPCTKTACTLDGGGRMQRRSWSAAPISRTGRRWAD